MEQMMSQEGLDQLNAWLDNHPLKSVCSLALEDVSNPDMSRHDEVVKRIELAWNKANADSWDAPVAYLPNEMWRKSVEDVRAGFIQSLERGQGVGNYLKNFWRNECSEHLLKYVTFDSLQEHGDLAKAHLQYKILKDVAVWAEYAEAHEISVLELPPIGNPFGCRVNNTLITGASLHSNYYAERIGKLIHEGSLVTEIGGGIGVMAYYLLQRNSSLRYVNFDLPDILPVCQYFLMMALPDKKFKLYGEDVEDIDIALLPTFCIEDMRDNSSDVVVNIHSLSEMTKEATEEYAKQISRICTGYFFHENSVVKQNFNETSLLNFKPEGFDRIYMLPAIWGESIYRENCMRKVE